MSSINSFPPLVGKDPGILILGSMPGKASLQASQYYAHPRNAFWFIMESLLTCERDLEYKQRQQLLSDNHIAVWDVLKSCYRDGSLDSSIAKDTMVPNDFIQFFSTHPTIRSVFFNGATAEKVFFKSFGENPLPQGNELNFVRLPSTSPAHAAMTRQQKLQDWRVVVQHLADARCIHHQA